MERAKVEMVHFWMDTYRPTPVQEFELVEYQQFLEREQARKLNLAPEKRTPPPVFELWRWQMGHAFLLQEAASMIGPAEIPFPQGYQMPQQYSNQQGMPATMELYFHREQWAFTQGLGPHGGLQGLAFAPQHLQTQWAR